MLKYLFEISTRLTTRPFQLVPRDFKFNHPAIYRNILNKQNHYLENHRNIAVVAIPTHVMEHCLTDRDGKTWNTLKDAILSVNGVTHVHACKRTLDLGKWNISTNIDEWAHVKTWLDVNLNKLFRRIPVSTRNKYPEYADFAKPTRLHANRFGTNVSRPDDRNQDAYAQLVQASILGDDTVKIPTRAQAPAWKTTPRLVYTLASEEAFMWVMTAPLLLLKDSVLFSTESDNLIKNPTII
jgi:hypothetical protein